MLILEVEFIVGRYAGARSPFDKASDFPPAEDRLFSALMASWGLCGRTNDAARALKWLERHSPARIAASPHGERTTPWTFVPVNEATLPRRRTRQRRRFPTAIPHVGVISYLWEAAEPDARTFASLQDLAHNTPYLGKTSSLVRCWFRQDRGAIESWPTVITPRRVYAGRFDELEWYFQRGKLPSPGASVPPEQPPRPVGPQSVFGTEWIVFADAGHRRPDLRRTAAATRAMRSALLRSFGRREAPEIISGHHRGVAGQPSRAPHLAIVPLANVAWRNADERVLGIALVLPRGASSQDRQEVAYAVARLHEECGVSGTESLELEVPLEAANPSGPAELWRLVREPAPAPRSLRSGRYARRARIWSTVTPIALDNAPVPGRPEERQRQAMDEIKFSCERIGLPRPSGIQVALHSAHAGSPSVPAWQNGSSQEIAAVLRRGGYASWEQWDLPTYIRHQPLTHATLSWQEPVEGPVILGAGRFVGLGLCLPLG